ncbi:MAG: DUF3325 domain-containing protein [Parahaliea sp.]
MAENLLLALALFASFCGMAWFALARNIHWRQVRNSREASPKTRTLFRVAGWLGLVGSLWLCLLADAPSMAVLVWIMSLALAALAVAMLLSWRPRWLILWTIGLH